MVPGMNALLEKYSSSGVVGLGFPCNQFKLQQPGYDSEVVDCFQYVKPGGNFTFNEDFNVFGLLDVNGATAHKMYKFLKSTCPAATEDIGSRSLFYWESINARDVTWNYGKFLIDANGYPRYRFVPTVTLEEIYPYVEELIAERDGQL